MVLTRRKTFNVTHTPTIHWYQKWNRLSMAIFVSILILSLVAFFIWTDGTGNTERNFILGRRSSRVETHLCVSNCYEISCENVREDNFPIMVQEISELISTQECTSVKLTLQSVYFPDGIMQEGWLSSGAETISSLTLKKTALKSIDTIALSSTYFPFLTELTIEDSEMLQLNHSFFDKMVLTAFQFRFINPTSVTVEPSFLRGMTKRLNTLQFQNALDKVEDLHALTGNLAVLLPFLKTLDLRNNALQVLNDGVFSSVPQVSQIFLANNLLTEITSHALGYGRIDLLYLNNNLLETLPEGVFDYVKEVYIAENDWVCNCSLFWMKNLYMTQRPLFRDQFLCDGKTADTTDFCNDPTYSTSPTNVSTTTISTSTGTTTGLPSLVNLECASYTQVDVPTAALTLLKEKDISIKQSKIKFSFYQLKSSNQIYMRVEGNVENNCVLYIETQNVTNSRCNQTQAGGLNEFILDLKHENTYTVCLIRDEFSEVSPYDCTAIYVPPDYDNQAWLTNKYKIIIISAVAGTILAITILTGLIVFFCIRQNPKFIKGNKRVVIIENKPVNPYLYTRGTRYSLFYPPPSLNSHSDGYLTPKIYDQVNELSTISHGKGYFPVWRQKKKKRDHLYEAPPLPPNHPLSSRIYQK